MQNLAGNEDGVWLMVARDKVAYGGQKGDIVGAIRWHIGRDRGVTRARFIAPVLW
jgi:hypothetical protein